MLNIKIKRDITVEVQMPVPVVVSLVDHGLPATVGAGEGAGTSIVEAQ